MKVQFLTAPAAALLSVTLACPGLPAQTAPAGSADRAHVEEVLRGLNRGRMIGQVALSPDGKRIAWSEGGGGGRGGGGGALRVAPLDNLSASQAVTAATAAGQRCAERELIWAPDSQSVAFFSDCASKDGQADLYISKLDGSPAEKVSNLKGYVHMPIFSPDGTHIAFLYVEGATRPAGALAAMKAPSGVIGEDGVEVQRIAVIRPKSTQHSEATFVTPKNLHCYEFSWAPDSKSLTYVAAPPPGENNWWVAKLYTQAMMGAPKAILAPAVTAGSIHNLQIAVPRWSPDGKAIAFIAGVMSDQGSTGGDVWIVSADGGTPHNLTPGRKASPAWIEWQDNNHLFVSELAGANSRLVPLTLSGADHTGAGVKATAGEPIYAVPGGVADGRISMSVSSSADHALWAFQASSFDRPTEIYLARTAKPSSKGFAGVEQLTHLNDGLTPEWGKAESLEWKNEGFNVQGWLLYPHDFDAAKKYPMIVAVHGGPASAVVARWGGGGGLSATAFSALGYFVLQVNPRGSYGQGEAFTAANRKDFGYGDLRDILAGVDTVLAKYPVDKNRIGLTGWSYGGFMTMFGVTQTNRFKAAVAGAGISDWQSYYGENSIDQWMIPYFGASVYDDPASYAKSSAINFIKKVKTPTLSVVGDRDGECPAPQSYEFWHALRDQKVPTQLVVYANEGHGFVNPEHRTDVMVRAIDWFAKYMPEQR